MKRAVFISILCAMVLAAGTGCQNENTPEDNTPKMRQLTIRMNDDEAGAQGILRAARATIVDGGSSSLSASWTAGDQLSYCNLSRTDYKNSEFILYTGALTASSTAATSELTGDVTCTADDYLAVVYPTNSTFDYDSPSASYTYTFPLSGQDGTLERLASTYHQQYGRAHVTGVTNNTATATMPKMKSLLTICKFSFTDGTNAIPIGTLTISYNNATSENGKYPQSATVTVQNTTEHANVHAVKADVTAALTVTCSTEQPNVYVALLPTSDQVTYNFTVTNSSGTYTGTAKATLKEGEYVPALGLKLQLQ